MSRKRFQSALPLLPSIFGRRDPSHHQEKLRGRIALAYAPARWNLVQPAV